MANRNPVAKSPRKPVGAEIRFEGVLRSIDIQKRTAIVEVEIQLDSQGREQFFGKPAPVTFRFEPTSFVTSESTPGRWLRLASVSPGHQVQIFAIPTKEAILAREMTLLRSSNETAPWWISPPPNPVLASDGVSMDRVVVPMVFPVLGKTTWSDTFLASRGGGTRRHLGQDIMGPKMLPLVACFDGVVTIRNAGQLSGNFLTLVGDNGWRANYIHINNDTPGTDDGLGTPDFAFVRGIRSGTRVVAGQIIAWNGDSGNAENTAPHLHFELWSLETGGCYNAAPSLRAATRIDRPIVNQVAPDFLPPAGIQRIDGFLRSLDENASAVTVDVVVTGMGSQEPRSITKPESLTLKMEDFSKWGVFGDRETTRPAPNSGAPVILFAQNGKVVSAFWQELVVGSQEPAPVEVLSDTTLFQQRLGESLIKEINDLRKAKGLPALTLSQPLTKLGQAHSSAMARLDFYGFVDPNGLNLKQEANKVGGAKAVALIGNQAVSASEMGKVFAQELGSVLLDPDLKSFGFGYSYWDDDPGTVRHKAYWTLILGG
ncbi:MAG: peptidoglycan DD-metalloendopeptidase family protein [Fimbriimonadaceae bacterium]|jgi:uncharacterized protein YkwD|nr:peptidoglycan DD-metalloendopeptidase family protein [Fimbriimonadaceae bacterium]